ncbi:type II toxin-antitoxin system RelE/ParE family toxin [Tannerella forsythia]|uniref:type II toxin-antitoxin system RelE family toxin n=1 Tax=Tannerella forsythia TaxID=28112 RepID=UPI0028EC9974|nr:type II toxin-antitoxin system RelE/ParE family toxin [Tannerella forsythia]
MDVQFSRKALKFLHAADRITKRRIQESVNGLLEVPPKGDIKAMQGQPSGTFRLRIGKYRIVYEVVSDVLRILNIGSRGDIYK